MQHGDGGMGYAVEHAGLHRRVVDHVLENHVVARMQLAVERPCAHVVAAQAAVAAQTVEMLPLAGLRARLADVGRQRLGTPHGGLVGHLQTIGHVACEADVEYGGAYAPILHHVHHLREQRTRLPGECRPGFEDQPQMRVTFVQTVEQTYQKPDVVPLAGHEVAAAQIEPLYLPEPRCETRFEMFERMRERRAVRLAVAMAVESLYALGQAVGQTVGRHSEAAPRSAGVV